MYNPALKNHDSFFNLPKNKPALCQICFHSRAAQYRDCECKPIRCTRLLAEKIVCLRRFRTLSQLNTHIEKDHPDRIASSTAFERYLRITDDRLTPMPNQQNVVPNETRKPSSPRISETPNDPPPAFLTPRNRKRKPQAQQKSKLQKCPICNHSRNKMDQNCLCKRFSCDLLLKNGSICLRRFRSRQLLKKHTKMDSKSHLSSSAHPDPEISTITTTAASGCEDSIPNKSISSSKKRKCASSQISGFSRF